MYSCCHVCARAWLQTSMSFFIFFLKCNPVSNPIVFFTICNPITYFYSYIFCILITQSYYKPSCNTSEYIKIISSMINWVELMSWLLKLKNLIDICVSDALKSLLVNTHKVDTDFATFLWSIITFFRECLWAHCASKTCNFFWKYYIQTLMPPRSLSIDRSYWFT